MNDYSANLSQGERLELSSRSIIIPPDSIGHDERQVISTPPNGFRMPSMQAVRMHDARLSLYGSDVNVSEDETDEDEDEEDEEEEEALDGFEGGGDSARKSAEAPAPAAAATTFGWGVFVGSPFSSVVTGL